MAVYVSEFGTLETFTSATSGSNSVDATGATGLVFHLGTTGGATLKLEQSIDAGTSWADVLDSTTAITSAANVGLSVTSPIGLYRATVTSHSSGTHTVKWRMNGRRTS